MKDEIARLTACAVEISHNRMTYFGPLIEGGVRDEETGQYVIEINPKIMAIYAAGWTGIDWEQRRKLGRKYLAKSLHSFYASHANPHPLTVEYLHQLTGSRTVIMRKFKQNLKVALEALVEVGAIRGFEIEDNLVSVDNVPSKSQQKYLTKARPRRK